MRDRIAEVDQLLARVPTGRREPTRAQAISIMQAIDRLSAAHRMLLGKLGAAETENDRLQFVLALDALRDRVRFAVGKAADSLGLPPEQLDIGTE
jgi:hypothetical protein